MVMWQLAKLVSCSASALLLARLHLPLCEADALTERFLVVLLRLCARLAHTLRINSP